MPLQQSDWVKFQAQAIWLEKFRLKNTAKMLYDLLGGDKKEDDE
ncbi:hypothetical protein ACFOWM_06275 [Ferruginibacter yonginensis]|uniref:Uncharacterized protein n=1 Tax=Ferruginibacter yonginensis TaxID=1310416 RepID=A0ABV8QRJ7_9BACT